MGRLEVVFYSLAGCILGKGCYYLLDKGLVNGLVLESLSHGTNLINYIGIRFFGGNPSYGGQRCGSTANNCNDDTRGYFYVFKDREFSHLRQVEYLAKDCPKIYSDQPAYYKNNPSMEIKETMYKKKWLPQHHAYLSAKNLFFFCIGKQKEMFLMQRLGNLVGRLNRIITPIIEFRYSEIDPKVFKDDPLYPGYAYKTASKVEAWRIGLLGSILAGINSKWFTRAKSDPKKAFRGIVQLTVGVALVYFGYHSSQKNISFKVSTIIGALLL